VQPEAAAKRKERKEEKYIEIACNHHFLPIAFETFAFETFGPINQVGADFILHWAIESLLTLTTHERHFLFFNAFPLRSSALMTSVSPIHSAI